MFTQKENASHHLHPEGECFALWENASHHLLLWLLKWLQASQKGCEALSSDLKTSVAQSRTEMDFLKF